MAQLTAVHKFAVYRLLHSDQKAAELKPNEGTPHDLAALLTEMSHQGRLGPVLQLPGHDALLVGELDGFIGMEIEQAVLPVGLVPQVGKQNRR